MSNRDIWDKTLGASTADATGRVFLDAGTVPRAGVGTAESTPEHIDRDAVISREAHKDDQGKVRMDLVHGDFVEEVAKVLTFGANKYAEHNWRKGFKWSRVMAACFRHLYAWMRGEDKDPETGLSHLSHAACCLMFLIVFEKRNAGEDDRSKEA